MDTALMSSRKYMIYTKKYKITLLMTLSIFVFSTFVPALIYAGPVADSASNWEYMNGDSWGGNNSPQTQMNRDNADAFEVKWIYPIGGSTLAPDAIQAVNPGGDATVTPIVVDGTVYVLTNYLGLFAIDAETGRQLWSYQYTVDIDDAVERLPISVGAPHLHGFRYWSTDDVILVPGLACEYVGVDAKTGEEKWTTDPYCTDVAGSIRPYIMGGMGMGTATMGTYEKGRMFITGMRGTEWIADAQGRSFVTGIDMDTKQVVWRVFNQPPQDRPDVDWALHECDVGWFGQGEGVAVPCSDVPESILKNDWLEDPNEPTSMFNSVTAMWGQPLVDEDTGYVYVATGNANPFFYTNYRPGPNLYAVTLQAIDTTVGQRVWWLQDTPRDPWDYDCNWSGFLSDDTALGKVYVKGCKIGYLNVLDAATGEVIHRTDIHNDADSRIGHKSNCEDTIGICEPLDIFSKEEIIDWPGPLYDESSAYDTPLLVSPGWWHGSFGSGISYDDGVTYHFAQKSPLIIDEFLDPFFNPGSPPDRDRDQQSNATLMARDLVTGELKWQWFYEWSPVRAFPVVTGDMVIAGFSDGMMRFFDKDNGQLMKELNVGAGMLVGPSVGKDSNGDTKIFAVIGTAWGPGQFVFDRSSTSGTLVAVGLSERAAAQVRTTTSTVTATTTTVQTTTTATTSVVSVTEEVTEEVGLSSTITYAAIAVAVIAVIAAAVLATRKT